MTDRDIRGGARAGSGTLKDRAWSARSFAATLVCALGLVIALGSSIAAVFAGVGVDIISGGAVGIALGVLGYSLGAGRLGAATVPFSASAMFSGLLVNQFIPGVGGDRELPAVEPRVDGMKVSVP